MRTSRLIFALVIASTTAAAHAAPDSLGLNQSFWVQLQGFRPSITSNGRIDNSNTGADGTSLSFEDDLGLKKRKNLAALLAGVRLGNNWRAEFEYYSLKRSGSETLDTAITVDDTVYPVSATVNTQFDTTVYRASVGYSFVRDASTEIGASLGAHVTRIKAAIEGIGTVVGVGSTAQVVEKDATVPLPTLGLYGTTALSDSFLLNARADLLYLKVKQSKGRLFNVAANLIYRFNPNVGLGVGYRYVDYNLKKSSGSTQGEFDYKYSGPQVLLDVGF